MAKHIHRYLPFKSKVARRGDGEMATQILFRCKCGDLSGMQLLGEWDESEVLHTPQKHSDRQFLKAVGIKVR